MFNIFYEDNLILNKSAFRFFCLLLDIVYILNVISKNDGFNNYTDIQ